MARFAGLQASAMIATTRFVFLHLHKSGGSFVNDVLLKFLPDAREIGYHLPRRLLPPALAQLPTLGFVRNPWSYYVSWYSFQARLPSPNPLFLTLSDGGQLSFSDTIRNMLDLGTGGTRLDALIAALPQHYTGRGLNLPGPALEPIRASGLGFYSYLYRYLYDGPGILFIRPMERLRDNLVPMLEGLGQPVSARMEQYIHTAPAVNASVHEAYVEYYDAALRDLVAERDAGLIKLYGYAFGS